MIAMDVADFPILLWNLLATAQLTFLNKLLMALYSFSSLTMTPVLTLQRVTNQSTPIKQLQIKLMLLKIIKLQPQIHQVQLMVQDYYRNLQTVIQCLNLQQKLTISQINQLKVTILWTLRHKITHSQMILEFKLFHLLIIPNNGMMKIQTISMTTTLF